MARILIVEDEVQLLVLASRFRARNDEGASWIARALHQRAPRYGRDARPIRAAKWILAQAIYMLAAVVKLISDAKG